MKTTRLFSVALLATLFAAPVLRGQSEADSLAFMAQDWNWIQVGNDAWAGHAEFQLFGAGQSISVVKYPAHGYKTSLIDAQREKRNSTDSLAIKAGARFACNGSYFDMRQLVPVTYISIAGKQLGATADGEKFRTNGLLAIKAGGHKMEIMPVDTSMLQKISKKYKYVIATGPLLILDGETQRYDYKGGFSTNRHPRTIVGKDASGYVYFIVIDGRWKNGKGTGATIAETAAVARYFGLVDALNFDGGGSSTVWTDKTGIINYPNDNGKWDHAGARKVPNCIIVR